MAINATAIANIIGMSARRNSRPKITHSEQMTSANMVHISERVLPIPNGSGKLMDNVPNAIHFSIP